MTRRSGRLILTLAAFVLSSLASGSPQAGPEPTRSPAADPAAAALARWDDETGLWIPPYASREVYLDWSEPRHGYIRDLDKAFEGDPALRKAVCALMRDPKRTVNPARLPPAARQLVTMFGMHCVGMEAKSPAGKGPVQREKGPLQREEATLVGWMNVAAARELEPEERRSRLEQLKAEWPKLADFEARRKSAFEMLGLMPQSEDVVYRLLDPSWSPSMMMSGSRIEDFLRRLFELESADGMPEAAPYRMALRNLYFYTGRLSEARELSRSLVEAKALAGWKVENRAFLAVLDRLAGDASALKNVASDCRPPAAERGAYEKRHVGAFCFDVADRIATKSVYLLEQEAPRGLVDVLTEAIAAEPSNYRRRVNAIHYIAILDPARAGALADELLELLGLPATMVPLDVRLQALAELADSSRRLGDFTRALKAYDLYLATIRYRPIPVPADLWARVTALPQEDRRFRAEQLRLGWVGISWALERKVLTYIDARDFPRAERAVEDLLAATFALCDATVKTGGTMTSGLVDTEKTNATEREELKVFLSTWDAQTVGRAARDQAPYRRSYLRSLGAALLKSGWRASAMGVTAYLITQPGGEDDLPVELYRLCYESKERGMPLKQAVRPWVPLHAGN